ncbi:MAG: hypothetical protein R6V54_04135 [Desulfobacteraceae bacterium]
MELIADNRSLIGWLGLISTLTFFTSLLIIPWLIARIPEDYFQHKKRLPVHSQSPHPNLKKCLAMGKNLIGGLFILAGIGMLFMPGQGILTILIGTMMTNFPGKYRLEQKLIRRPAIIGTINWIRNRSNQPPLIITPKHPQQGQKTNDIQ